MNPSSPPSGPPIPDRRSARRGFSGDDATTPEGRRRMNSPAHHGFRLTCTNLLKDCITSKLLPDGRILHFLISSHGFESDYFYGAQLIRFYSECYHLRDACESFRCLRNPNSFAWSAIISAHTKLGEPYQAVVLYRRMLLLAAPVDGYVVVAALQACTQLSLLCLGKIIHVESIYREFLTIDFVCNVLIDMYAKCGRLDCAIQVFGQMVQRDVVAWNALINGHIDHGYAESALHLFCQMLDECVEPDYVTILAVLKSSPHVKRSEVAALAHSLMVEGGMEGNLNTNSAVIDTYVTNGSLQDAYNVFLNMPQRNVVAWTAIATGYTQFGESLEAIQLFDQMRQEGICPDHVMLVSILQACSAILGLDQGKRIHLYILDNFDETDPIIGSALIDMYCKCGNMECASQVFHKLRRPNVVIWNAMINGYAQHGAHELALLCLKRMQLEGIAPDDATIISFLSACSHVGDLDAGFLLQSVVAEYGLVLNLEHYMCIVDLLGRTGHAKEAESLLQSLPFSPCEVGWRTLLGHCRTLGDVNLAKRCYDNLVLIDKADRTSYALMAEIYSDAGMIEELEDLKRTAFALL